MSGQPNPPLSEGEIARVHRLVNRFLPADYDREWVADTIILNAWMNGLTSVSYNYIRNKCISAWRDRNREQRKNEESVTDLTRFNRIDPIKQVENKALVQQMVSRLSPLERKIIWLKFWDSQTLANIAVNCNLKREQVQQLLQAAIYKIKSNQGDS